jgi:hypothetical protein
MLSGLISAWRILAFFSNFKARNSCWLYDLTAFTCNPTSFPYFFRTCKEKQSDGSGHRGGDSRDRRLLRCAAQYSLIEVDYLAGCVQYYTFVTLRRHIPCAVLVWYEILHISIVFNTCYYATKCNFLTSTSTSLSTFLCWYKRPKWWKLQSMNSVSTA